MDVSEEKYFNGDGKGFGSLFVKKDDAGKSKLTTGAKVGAGVVAGGLGLLAASQLSKKKKSEAGTTFLQETTKEASKQSVEPSINTEAKKSNTMLYVGLGVGAIFIVGLIIYATKK